jgi:NACalpha-BTF3-like transcription factor
MAMLSSAPEQQQQQQQLTACNAQDVQLICKELEVSKPVAEKALRACGGDLKSALRQLISQPTYN